MSKRNTQQTCKIVNCDNPAKSHKLCSGHYARLARLKHGDKLDTSPVTTDRRYLNGNICSKCRVGAVLKHRDLHMCLNNDCQRFEYQPDYIPTDGESWHGHDTVALA